MDSLWFKDAIIYQVYAPAFFDTNADGLGDIGGLTEKLDYLESLGVSAIWILGLADPTADALRPDATSEGGDALQDFKTLIRQAHARRMRVIATLTPHLMTDAQPLDRTHVTDSTVRSARVWLDCGVDGIEVDLSSSMRTAASTTGLSIHDVFKLVRAAVDHAYANRVIVAEADQRPEDAASYFGKGDECHLTFNTGLCARLLLALETEDCRWLVDFVRDQPEIPPQCQWALFLRNHNELAVTACSELERNEIRRAYATDLRMQLNGGIRRRLAPLLDNDRRRIELAYGLLFSLPGTPVVYYGNEIGMGDNINLGDRSGMRTPMQWSADRNAGFSRANPERLHAAMAAPVNADPVYGYHAVNVESQERQPYSLLKWMRRVMKVRNEQQTFGRGTIEFVETRNSRILAYIRRHGESRILVVANLAGTSQSVELLLGRYSGSLPIEMLGGIPFRRIGATPYSLSFAPYGFYWFALTARAKRDVPPMYRDNVGTSTTSGPPGVAASNGRRASSTGAECQHVNE